jgi:peptide/nickel transport system permease protein
MPALLKDRQARLAALGLAVLVVLALAAPLLSGGDPDRIDLSRRLLPPGQGGILGTDSLGRDLWARMLHGARVSLGVGTLAMVLMTLIGIGMGTTAAHFRGAVDMAIMRLIDVLLCIPSLFLVLALIVMIGPGIQSVIIVVVLTGWTDTARLVRSEMLSLRDREFVLSARASGAGTARIMLKHLIPNALAPVYVVATFGVAGAILMESSLSFLGLGVQAPASSWGNILDDGRQYIGSAWWLTVFPGLAILSTMLLINSLGGALRRHFDVRGRGRNVPA